jgi:hypothetical protein
MDRRGNAVVCHHDHKEYRDTCTDSEKLDPVAHPECAAA